MATEITNNEAVRMDYQIKDPEARVQRVEEIIANTPSEKLTPYYLGKLSEYIVEPIEKEERKKNLIITQNHLKNIRGRELSFEGLAGKLENGEDGIYNMIANDKNILFTHNNKYTDEDIDNIPGLREYVDAIDKVEEQFKAAKGKRRFLLKKQLIEMHQDKYEIGKSYRRPIYMINIIKSIPKLDLNENITVDAEGGVSSDGIVSLYDPKHVSLLLCNYSSLKQESWEKFNSDIKWMMEDLDALVEKTLKNFPLYKDILIYKIDGKSNAEIQNLISIKYNIRHTVEYISSLWRNKIPKMIADQASADYIEWYYSNKAEGKYKKCSRCGQIKLMLPRYFSKNNTSKDGYYSICKECRNKKEN